MHSGFAHSCVSTVSIHAGLLEDSRTGSTWEVEPLLIPQVPVASTDHVSIDKAVVWNLERVCVGTGLLTFLMTLMGIGTLSATVILVHCDQASSNFVMIRKLAAWVA